MDPELWGPPIWSLLFSISFRAKTENILDISEALKLLEKLIPCPSCKAHYIVNRKKWDRLFPHINLTNIKKWLWNMKNDVNRLTHKKSITFSELEKRYRFFDHTICDTALADSLMLMCTYIKNEEEEVFKRFIYLIGKLTSSFLQGPFSSLLLCLTEPVKQDFLDIVNTLRKSYDMNSRVQSFYTIFN
tara:strand:+ start:2371 stop:2934 length:564 start_codon:yes stop_codon:yes gene_type:complete